MPSRLSPYFPNYTEELFYSSIFLFKLTVNPNINPSPTTPLLFLVISGDTSVDTGIIKKTRN